MESLESSVKQPQLSLSLSFVIFREILFSKLGLTVGSVSSISRNVSLLFTTGHCVERCVEAEEYQSFSHCCGT